jgi:hypothetical protein
MKPNFGATSEDYARIERGFPILCLRDSPHTGSVSPDNLSLTSGPAPELLRAGSRVVVAM